MKFSKHAFIYLTPLSLATHVLSLAISTINQKRHLYSHSRTERGSAVESLPWSEAETTEWNHSITTTVDENVIIAGIHKVRRVGEIGSPADGLGRKCKSLLILISICRYEIRKFVRLINLI